MSLAALHELLFLRVCKMGTVANFGWIQNKLGRKWYGAGLQNTSTPMLWKPVFTPTRTAWLAFLRSQDFGVMWLGFYVKRKEKSQRVPQSQATALPKHQEEAETDKTKQAKSNKRTKSTKISSSLSSLRKVIAMLKGFFTKSSNVDCGVMYRFFTKSSNVDCGVVCLALLRSQVT